MVVRPLSLRLLPAIIAAVALGVAAAPAGAQQVGVNSAVNPDATGTPPSATTRKLVIGQEVLHNEKIATGPLGQTQILFLDESAMTVGPNADITIDEFVYDPNTGKGRLAMSATQGVMRFVGGRLSKSEDAVTMRTPSGSLGIRGGIFLIDQQAAGPLNVVFMFGKGLTVTGTNGASQSIVRPGFSVSVAGRGAPPTQPVPATTAQIAGLLAALSGRTNANGGARTVPSDASVVDSGVSNTISGNITASVQSAMAHQPTAPQPQGVNVGTTQTSFQSNTAVAQAALNTPGGSVQFTQGFGVVLQTNGGSAFQSTGGGTLSNGVFTIPAQPPAFPTTVSFPLPPGTATFNNGQTFLSPDQSSFAAAVNTGGGLGAPGGQTAFVFGGIPTVNLPTSGVAAYSGSAFGGVFNSGATRTASGAVSASFNFGSQTGNLTISNFDGKTFSGPILVNNAALSSNPILAGSGAVYAVPLTGSGVSGAAAGSFFGTGASSTAGLFAVAALPSTPGGIAPYSAAGVFAGGKAIPQ